MVAISKRPHHKSRAGFFFREFISSYTTDHFHTMIKMWYHNFFPIFESNLQSTGKRGPEMLPEAEKPKSREAEKPRSPTQAEQPRSREAAKYDTSREAEKPRSREAT